MRSPDPNDDEEIAPPHVFERKAAAAKRYGHTLIKVNSGYLLMMGGMTIHHPTWERTVQTLHKMGVTDD